MLSGRKINLKDPNKAEENVISSYYYFNSKNRLREKEHHRGPCVPGVRKLFVNSEGLFLPCEKVSEISEKMIIGNVNSGFDYNKIFNILNIGKLTEENCKNCTAIRHCSICAKEIDNITDFSVDIKKKICQNKIKFLKEKVEQNFIFQRCGLFENI